MGTNTHAAPSLALYHANARRSGSAIRFDLHAAAGNVVDVEGFIRLTIAPQDDSEEAFYPRFKWVGAPAVSLHFLDVCEFLRVFRGDCESIADGRGLWHITPTHSTTANIRHVVEPVEAFEVELVNHGLGDSREIMTTARFLLTPSEAMGVAAVFEHSLSVIAFGRNA